MTHPNSLLSLILCIPFILEVIYMYNKIFKNIIETVRYHSGGSVDLNTRILLLAYMVYL